MQSKQDERNALAELANELTWIEDILRDEGYSTYCSDANKAQRIIAELAKVDTLTLEGGMLISLPSQACEAVDRCRAIAEEGESNG